MTTRNVNMLSAEVKHTFAGVGLNYYAMETMGDRIRILRKSKDWTQEEMASRLGVTRASVSQWERGETANIKNITFLTLVRELGTTPEYLLFGPDRPGRDSDGRYRSKKFS